jgi:hypothetical protein
MIALLVLLTAGRLMVRHPWVTLIVFAVIAMAIA